MMRPCHQAMVCGAVRFVATLRCVSSAAAQGALVPAVRPSALACLAKVSRAARSAGLTLDRAITGGNYALPAEGRWHSALPSDERGRGESGAGQSDPLPLTAANAGSARVISALAV